MMCIWLIIDASMAPYFARHLQNDALLIPGICGREHLSSHAENCRGDWASPGH